MKRLLLMLLVIFQLSSMSAQTKRFYCEIIGTQKELTSGLKIVLDFGENPIYSDWSGLKSKQKLVDDQGNEIPFYSMVDAGNYMSDKGWMFLQAYTSFYSGHTIVHWVFYKDAEDAKSAIEGIMTKDSYKKKKANNEP
ncbi:MAG: hypothetical protein IKX59_03565 [Bacteroidales bacterium]|nr:hypothetical protein [Bacteroidales bacterium]